MTEAEWSQCGNAVELLSHLHRQRGILRTKRGRRKVWLFIAACFRSSWHLLCDEGRAVVELFERHADEQVTQADIEARQQTMFAAYQAVDYSSLSATARMRDWLAFALWQLTITRTTQEVVRAVYQWDAQDIRNLKAWRRFPILLRDIFVNPFRPVTVDPSWLVWNDGTVVKLAQAIYDERAFDRLPMLADALEEAGCDNTDILNHCRQRGEHVRGCWMVDLLLGKE